MRFVDESHDVGLGTASFVDVVRSGRGSMWTYPGMIGELGTHKCRESGELADTEDAGCRLHPSWLLER